MFEIKKDFSGKRYIEATVNDNKYEIRRESDGSWHIIKVYYGLRTEAGYLECNTYWFQCEPFPTVIHACKWFKKNIDKLI